MNKNLLLLLFAGCGLQAQSIIQSVNAGAISGATATISVGEIVVVPQNANQSPSGLVGILGQQPNLSVPQLELADAVTVFPNPTVAGLYFRSSETLSGRRVVISNGAGQQVLQARLSAENGIDLSVLAAGIYFVRLDGNEKTFKIIKNQP